MLQGTQPIRAASEKEIKGVKDMECPKVQRKISAYLDGSLDSTSSRIVERHISQCGTCQRIVADFQRIDDLMRALPKFDMGPGFVGQLLEEVSGSRAPALTRHSDRSLFAPVIRFMSGFMDLLEGRKAPSTHTLDEFADFPPFSLGYIYFKLLDQPERG
jgi:anti-sigma factor RsiW